MHSANLAALKPNPYSNYNLARSSRARNPSEIEGLILQIKGLEPQRANYNPHPLRNLCFATPEKKKDGSSASAPPYCPCSPLLPLPTCHRGDLHSILTCTHALIMTLSHPYHQRQGMKCTDCGTNVHKKCKDTQKTKGCTSALAYCHCYRCLG